MEKLTRRKLITTVSAGAGMAGILAATASCAPSDNTPASAVSRPSGKVPTDPLAVFVTDPERGTLVIMNGDREVTITNASLAQSLLSLS
jgi:hypothetical protein